MQSCASGGGSRGGKNTEGYSKEGNQITVNGEAPIYQGDKALAKTKAVKDAKNTAVRKLIGEEISSKAGVADGESLGSSLIAKTDGFVKSFEVLSEETYKIDTQDMIKVTVRCIVEESKLNTAVDALMADIGHPKTMVLIKVDMGGSIQNPGSANNTAEAMMIDILKKGGNKIVDPGVARKLLSSNPKAAADADPDDIKEGSPLITIAQDAGAEVL
ncbi:MAG: lipoprotein LipL46, partial [Leptospira sp.]|nr:lipoprotein LipL46 [Leptospira sp.]